MEEDDELLRRIEQISLPSRDSHVNERSEGFGLDTWCFINVFNISTENAPSVIFKYDLTFIVTKSNGKEVQLHNALIKANEMLRSKKRNALAVLQRMMHQTAEEFFKGQQLGNADTTNWRTCCAFDCGASYYTGVQLPDASGEIPEELWKHNGMVVSYVISGTGSIKWKLTHVESFPIDGDNIKSPQSLQFFDVLAMQKLIRDVEIDVKPDAAYMPGGDVTKDLKQFRKGIVTASRVYGDTLSIQMDSKIAPFFQNLPLLDYIRKSCKIENEALLAQFLLDRVRSRHLRKEMKNLPLVCRHIPTKRTFECKGIHTDSANSTTFMLKEATAPISVADYFIDRYKYRLNYPNLPLIVENARGGGKSFHPIECLDIAEGVRVSSQKMSREAQEQAIKSSCRAPAALGLDLVKSREVAGLDGQNKYLNSFNVKSTGEFAKVDGKILAKPFIVGLGGMRPEITERGQIGYTKGNFRFADPAKPPHPITLIPLDNPMTAEDIERIKVEMRRVAGGLGMSIAFSNVVVPALFNNQFDALRDFMEEQKRNTSMFFFITADKLDESHDTVKKLEQELGVVTQSMWAQTATAFLKNQRTTTYNIIAKMNQKLGGVGANPEVPPDLQRTNPEAYQRALKDWFPNRMFVGLTLSHAGAQSYADRLVGEEVKEPTCVGMAFTLSQPGKRTAMSWFQEKRKAIIDDITRHFVRALDIYSESNKNKMPTSILIFRKGLSDGELKKAAYEVNQINDAILEVRKRPGMEHYDPTIQCIVCRTNSSDRLFYQGGNANVPAGTCLDQGATHPDRAEFLIVPHNALQGTSKAVKCTVVCNFQGREGRRLEFVEIQSIYHTMCYLNGIAASPTRLPVPLADSEKAAERQMNNFKFSLRSGEDSNSLSSGQSTGGVVHDGTDSFYQKLSDQFAHKFKSNQYYA